jgi:hypothetical protein
VCSSLWERSNATWSGFAAPCEGKGWSLRMIAKNVGVSTACVARTPEKIKAKRECDDHYFTVVFQTVGYYR